VSSSDPDWRRYAMACLSANSQFLIQTVPIDIDPAIMDYFPISSTTTGDYSSYLVRETLRDRVDCDPNCSGLVTAGTFQVVVRTRTDHVSLSMPYAGKSQLPTTPGIVPAGGSSYTEVYVRVLGVASVSQAGPPVLAFEPTPAAVFPSINLRPGL
jgi:hypothetical protein